MNFFQDDLYITKLLTKKSISSNRVFHKIIIPVKGIIIPKIGEFLETSFIKLKRRLFFSEPFQYFSTVKIVFYTGKTISKHATIS